MALRLSGSIMELLQALVKLGPPAQQRAGQQVGLGVKGPALGTWVDGFQLHPLEALPQALQIFEQDAFELVAAFLILRRLLHLLERPAQLAAVDRLAQS